MTEEEAKTKLCPQWIAAERRICCEGSACMAWRWNKHWAETEIASGIPLQSKVTISDTEGHCGLAGSE